MSDSTSTAATVAQVAREYRPNNIPEYLILFSAVCFVAYFYFNSKRKKGNVDDSSREAASLATIEKRQYRDNERIEQNETDITELFSSVKEQTGINLEITKDLGEVSGMMKVLLDKGHNS